MANTLIVSLGLLALASVALTLKRIHIGDPDYEGLCPMPRANDDQSTLVAVKDQCQKKKYIMCHKGVPIFERSCPNSVPHFDPESKQCRRAEEVPLPPTCGQTDERPLTCAEGARNMANSTTCRWYISCNFGKQIPMPCQNGSYFIVDRCVPYILHYAESIPATMLEHCQDLDLSNPLPGFTDAGL